MAYTSINVHEAVKLIVTPSTVNRNWRKIIITDARGETLELTVFAHNDAPIACAYEDAPNAD